MQDYQREFIEQALARGVLKFGEFQLKSGRLSPYFFNAGEFSSGAALEVLGRCYAAAIIRSGIVFDMLFGPAYKGIPLVAATAIALSREHGRDVPYCFNRKEAKAHGEKGLLVGAPLSGRVLIVDDVITAGTAIREVMAILAQSGARAVGVAIGLDRRERGEGQVSAIQEAESRYGITVTSIIELGDIVRYLEGERENEPVLEKIAKYRSEYGV